MIIYGVALLSLCLLVGQFAGQLIGTAIGVNANVGGVGIAMLLLVVIANTANKRLRIGPVSSQGVQFWSAMYIPIVVAMAAKQNVVAAIASGPVALVAGALAVVAGFLMIPLLSHWGNETPADAKTLEENPEQSP